MVFTNTHRFECTAYRLGHTTHPLLRFTAARAGPAFPHQYGGVSGQAWDRGANAASAKQRLRQRVDTVLTEQDLVNVYGCWVDAPAVDDADDVPEHTPLRPPEAAKAAAGRSSAGRRVRRRRRLKKELNRVEGSTRLHDWAGASAFVSALRARVSACHEAAEGRRQEAPVVWG